jgi:23S rRNA pseudouridine1911/1915/1917 synthase
VLIAKNMASAAILYDAMKRREIHREYFSIVHGRLSDSICVTPPSPADNAQIAPSVWPEFPGIIDLPIARIPGSTIMRMISLSGGKRAVTHFRAVQYDAETDTTALRIRLETGRTHQIRVHMAAIGHPVAGDGMYGTADGLIGRQALHSRVLEFCHPITRQKLYFECPVPEDMRRLCSSFSLQV